MRAVKEMEENLKRKQIDMESGPKVFTTSEAHAYASLRRKQLLEELHDDISKAQKAQNERL